MRDLLMGQASRLVQDPRFAKLMQDERVLKAVTRAFELRGQVQAEVDRRVGAVAKTLNLATKQEVRDLKRAIRKLERDLEQARAVAARAAVEAERAPGDGG